MSYSCMEKLSTAILLQIRFEDAHVETYEQALAIIEEEERAELAALELSSERVVE